MERGVVGVTGVTDELRVLCVNAGSSSVKLALWSLGPTETLLGSGSAEAIGTPRAKLQLRAASGQPVQATIAGESLRDLPSALSALLDTAARHWPEPLAVGHRVVHGGPKHAAPERIDDTLRASLRELSAFAPAHMPAAISGIDAIAKRYPQLPQVACFDTAFHRHLPELAQRLPLPDALWQLGVRRYGFHGLSYEYVVSTLGPALAGRTIIAHLGNGASMVALRDGKPIDTSMGFSPTGGFMMGSRSGDLDPGVLLYLLRQQHRDADALEHLLDHESGMRGVSGNSADMQTLLAACEADPKAALAIEMFCYQVRKQIGAYAAALGGLDGLVFTGGIGEHAALVRAKVCAELAYLGLELDQSQNQAHAAVVSRAESRVCVRVIATDEDRMIARHTRTLLYSQRG